MSRRTSDPDDDETPEPEAEDEEEEEAAAPRRSPSRRPTTRVPPKKRPRPIRTWSKDATASDDAMEEDDDEAPGPAAAKRPRVYWRARDSLYFAPLVALMIVILLVVGMYAYTQNWPPVYVVESESMQHGTSDILGVINTGDLVLAARVANSSIQPYVVAHQDGYSTYGEYGDVLLYYPDGVVGTPVIHRAIVFLDWDPSVHGYSALGLSGLPCGSNPNAVYATPGTTDGCGTTGLTGTLDLFHVGWADINVSIALNPTYLGTHSGYITMGDNNFNPGLGGEYDQSAEFQLSELVEPAWVIGVARGMIPWVGALKLWIEGSPTVSEVPPQSWQFLGLTFAGIILLAFGLHYALRAEGIEDPRRKEEEEEDEEAAEEEAPPTGARRFLRALRPWGRSDEEEDEGPAEKGAPRTTARPAKAPSTARRGRPKPKVRRPRKAKPADDEDDDEL
jgi:signal peptidase I